MRKLILAAALALSVSGCGASGGLNIPAAPVEVADQTTLDERGAIAVEVAYKAFRTAAEFGTDAGMIRGETATRVARLDDLAFAAVGAARAAYRAGNSESYEEAVKTALAAVGKAMAAINGA